MSQEQVVVGPNHYVSRAFAAFQRIPVTTTLALLQHCRCLSGWLPVAARAGPPESRQSGYHNYHKLS